MKQILNVIIILFLTIVNVTAVSITDSTAACHRTNGQSLYVYGETSVNYCKCDTNKFIVTTDFLSWTGCNDSRNSFITEEEFIQDLKNKAKTAISVSGNMEKEYLDIVSNQIDKKAMQENLQSEEEMNKNAYYLIGLVILIFIVYKIFKSIKRKKGAKNK